MNSITDCASTVFSRTLHVDEKSEGLCQSDFRVQKMPASVSSSELSARQMGEPLAGEGSERYSKAAKHKIAAMQTAVAMTFKNPEPEPLGEANEKGCTSVKETIREPKGSMLNLFLERLTLMTRLMRKSP